MKKTNLTLRKQTIVNLDKTEMSGVNGGYDGDVNTGVLESRDCSTLYPTSHCLTTRCQSLKCFSMLCPTIE